MLDSNLEGLNPLLFLTKKIFPYFTKRGNEGIVSEKYMLKFHRDFSTISRYSCRCGEGEEERKLPLSRKWLSSFWGGNLQFPPT